MAKRRSKPINVGDVLRRSKGTRALARMLRLAGNDVLVTKGDLNTFVGTVKTTPFEIELKDGEVERIRTSLIDDIIFKNPAQPLGDKMFLADGGVLLGTILTDPVVMHTNRRDRRFRTATIAGIVFGG
jgi:hypothetical protein